MQCSAVYFLMIWYRHATCLFSENNARQVDVASFLPTDFKIIPLAKDYDFLARKSPKFRHKEYWDFVIDKNRGSSAK